MVEVVPSSEVSQTAKAAPEWRVQLLGAPRLTNSATYTHGVT